MNKKLMLAALLAVMPGLASAFSVEPVDDYADALAIVDPETSLDLPTGATWIDAPLIVAPDNSVGGQYRSPYETANSVVPGYAASDGFFSVGVGNTYDDTANPAVLDMGGDVGFLGLFWGSPDSYNTLELYDDGELVFTVTGNSFGNQAIEASWVTITTGASEKFDTLRFYSHNRNAFEFSNIVTINPTLTSMPVPAAGLLLLAGIGVLGAIGRRRR